MRRERDGEFTQTASSCILSLSFFFFPLSKVIEQRQDAAKQSKFFQRGRGCDAGSVHRALRYLITAQDFGLDFNGTRARQRKSKQEAKQDEGNVPSVGDVFLYHLLFSVANANASWSTCLPVDLSCSIEEARAEV